MYIRRDSAVKIFLDDQRPCPKGLGYECARNFKMCKLWIDICKGKLEFVDLDYSIGDNETGLDVLSYLKEKKVIVEHINIEGEHAMRRFAEANFPDAIITSHKYD